MTAAPDLEAPTVLDMLDRLRTGSVSARAVVTSALERCRQEQDLNAMISLRAEEALAEADEADRQRTGGALVGPLHGLPIVVKDNVAVGGWQFTGGSPALEGHVASADATVVAALRKAGAIVIGKSNLHELALGTTSNNARFGPVRNPRDANRTAGGSSGGSAAAIAEGFVTAAVSSDTGGSGRIPAAFCGCVGFRPTIGRYAGDGVLNICPTRDTITTMANSVADIALLDGVITGDRDALQKISKPIRLGLLKPFAETDLDADVRAAFGAGVAALGYAGVEFVSVDGAELLEIDLEIGFGIVAAESVRIWRKRAPEILGISFEQFVERIGSPDVKGFLASASQPANEVSDETYQRFITQRLPRLRAAYEELFSTSGVDAFVFPTVPAVAPPVGEDETIVIDGKNFPLFPTTIRNTAPGTVAGVPGITLPLPVAAGKLPVGLALDAPSGSDRMLLSLAGTIEKLLAQKN
ncbi:MAG: amidase family protein [Rhizobiaceae bacterium]